MGLISNKVERYEIKPGDHIYTYRAVFTYSHHVYAAGQLYFSFSALVAKTSLLISNPYEIHDEEYLSLFDFGTFGLDFLELLEAGIFVGGSKVVHFRPERNLKSIAETSSNLDDPTSNPCPTFPDCGFRQLNSGVVLSCLDCFLRNGSLYCFEYEVSSSVFLTRIRGGTCTTASSDPSETVIHRAMYLLQNGFGNYDVFQNNCEDFALYCKTGLLIQDSQGVGRSGQASSIIGAPLAAMISSPLKLLMPSPVGVATVTAGMYCMSRYATDIGVRSDVIKVPVEDLAVNLGWNGPQEEVAENETSDRQITTT
ncbi:hypothetical protein ACSQ67_012337 [Phaseolus vulgaris]